MGDEDHVILLLAMVILLLGAMASYLEWPFQQSPGHHITIQQVSAASHSEALISDEKGRPEKAAFSH